MLGEFERQYLMYHANLQRLQWSNYFKRDDYHKYKLCGYGEWIQLLC